MTKTLINPTREELSAAVAEANDDATYRARTRTCTLPASIVDAILDETEGIYEDDGGGVPNSYKYPAETSHVVAAWWTNPAGDKHVRIKGARVSARKSAYGSAGGCSSTRQTGWAAVYPERHAQLDEARRQRCLRAIERVGHQSDDDRLGIWRPYLIAVSDEGLLVADHPTRPATVQVVVRDTTTGQRHHITVPPRFGHPERKVYRQIVAEHGKAGLVRAALAWTFDLTPAEYAPAVEA